MADDTGLKAALSRGIFGTAGLRATQAALSLLIAVVLARLLAPAGYGSYAFAMAIVAFLAIPSELGIPGLAMREVAVTNARGEWGRMRGFIAWSHGWIFVVSLVILAAGAAALFAFRERIDPVRLQCIGLGLLLIPLISLGALRSAMLQGLRKVVLAQLPEQVIRPAVFLALVIATGLWASGVDSAPEAIALQIAAATAAFAAGLWFFLRHRPAALGTEAPVRQGELWRKSALAFGLFAAMRLVNGRTDLVVLGLFHADADVGIYRVATQLAITIIFGLQIVNPVQGPHLAHIYATGDMQQFQRVVTRTSRIIFLITIPVFCVVIAFGRPLIAAVFGAEFGQAYVPLVVLAGGQLVNASLGSVGSVLNMTGHERDTAWCVGAGAIVNIALNLLLTPPMGMLGAAIATSVSLITWNLLMWRQVRARLGIETSVLRPRGSGRRRDDRPGGER